MLDCGHPCAGTCQTCKIYTFPIILYLNRRHLKSNRVLSTSVFSLESLKTQKSLKKHKNIKSGILATHLTKHVKINKFAIFKSFYTKNDANSN